VPFRALFQARTGTQVEPPTFRKVAGKLPHINFKESKVPFGIRTHRVRGKWFEVNDINHSATTVCIPEPLVRHFGHCQCISARAAFKSHKESCRLASAASLLLHITLAACANKRV
jgi:hypothetical protein